MSVTSFNKANQKVHPVETQWHYDRMVAAGFTPITKSQTGFVRKYEYENAEGHKIDVHTGANADYWRDRTTGEGGYGSMLSRHLASISN